MEVCDRPAACGSWLLGFIEEPTDPPTTLDIVSDVIGDFQIEFYDCDGVFSCMEGLVATLYRVGGGVGELEIWSIDPAATVADPSQCFGVVPLSDFGIVCGTPELGVAFYLYCGQTASSPAAICWRADLGFFSSEEDPFNECLTTGESIIDRNSSGDGCWNPGDAFMDAFYDENASTGGTIDPIDPNVFSIMGEVNTEDFQFSCFELAFGRMRFLITHLVPIP